MKHGTPIEWTHKPGYRGETWNPISGCSVSSPGCKNCYAMLLAGTRLAQHPLYAGVTTKTKAGPVFNGKMKAAPGDHKTWLQPIRWRAPRAIFVGDMCDLMHPARPVEVIAMVFARMAITPQHIYFVLTKHPERMREVLTDDWFKTLVSAALSEMLDGEWIWSRSGATYRPRIEELVARFIGEDADDDRGIIYHDNPLPLPNVWLGVSAENQEWADKRIPVLLDTPAAIRFVSCEPLLGSLDLTEYLWADCSAPHCSCETDDDCVELRGKLDWVIAGGESGPRPAHPTWFRALRDDCAAAGVPFFFKQWGSWALTSPVMADVEVVYSDGRHGPATFDYIHSQNTQDLHQGHEPQLMYRVGKRVAGAELDGNIVRAWPSVS